MGYLYTYRNKLLRRGTTLAVNTRCCCEALKLCVVAGADSPLYANELVVNESSDLFVCAAVSAFNRGVCPLGARPGFYLSDAKIAAYLAAGGVYFCNTEWDNCVTLLGYSSLACEPSSSAWFNAHMAAIGAGITRGAPTASTETTYANTGTPLFAGMGLYGNATSGLNGGTPIATGAGGNSYFCPSSPGGVVATGQQVGNGVVIALGDSEFITDNPGLLGTRLKTMNPAAML